jgi:uncharacterized membrane protein
MERDTVIIGVVFIVVGAIIFFMGNTINNSADYRMNLYFGGGSNWAPAMSGFGIILLIVGFIVAIVGVSREEKQKKLPDDVKCQICGIPKGDQHFYVVNKKDKKLVVCGQCVEPFRKEIATENKAIEKPSTTSDESLNILKTRYAKGEITKEQFEQMKKDLEG